MCKKTMNIITMFHTEKDINPKIIYSIGRSNGKPFSCSIHINKKVPEWSTCLSLDKQIDKKFYIDIKKMLIDTYIKEKNVSYIGEYDYLNYLEEYFGIDYVNGFIYITDSYKIKIPPLKKFCLDILKRKIRRDMKNRSLIFHTHTGRDLDQNMSLLVMSKLANVHYSELNVKKYSQSLGHHEGIILDLYYNGSKMNLNKDTLVFDHHDGSAPNTVKKLKDIGIFIPDDLIEIADQNVKKDITVFDEIWFNYYRYLNNDYQWNLFCDKGKVWKKITEEEKDNYKIRKKMKNNFDNLIEQMIYLIPCTYQTKEYGKVVLVDKFIPAGGILSFNELGADYYISVSNNNGASTFAISINRNDDRVLPDKIIEFCKSITPAIYQHISGKMITLGGPKNVSVMLQDSGTEIISKFKQFFNIEKRNMNEYLHNNPVFYVKFNNCLPNLDNIKVYDRGFAIIRSIEDIVKLNTLKKCKSVRQLTYTGKKFVTKDFKQQL